MSTNRSRPSPAESHRESHAPRKWLHTFSEPGVLLDAYRAARACMKAADDCEPDLCSHRVNQMTPLEFVMWIEDELHSAKRQPQRLDHTENRSAGHLRPILEIVSG